MWPLKPHGPSTALTRSEAGAARAGRSAWANAVTPPDWLRPDWNVPVRALMSTRSGGVSTGPFASLNVSPFVGDDASAVLENRARVERALGLPIFTPRLVHGATVVRVDARSFQTDVPQADACWSSDPTLACAVTAADCLPVLLATPDGRAVAAAHAGWRGLAAGVLRHTVAALAHGASRPPQDVHAWLGACIGPQHFEVGEDVLRAFGVSTGQPGPFFVHRPSPDGTARWLANLPALAREQLRTAGVQHISGGEHCTVADPARFFSYRRERTTGRMVAAIACHTSA